VVAKFCAKYLHQQVLKNEAYIAGDIGTSLKESFFRLEENEGALMFVTKSGSSVMSSEYSDRSCLFVCTI